LFAPLLANIPDDDQKDLLMPTPTRLIKARQFYSQKVAQLQLVRPSSESAAQSGTIGGKWFEPALDLIVCYSWFEYLSSSNGMGLESGIKVFEAAIQELDFRNPDNEMEVPFDAPDSHESQRQSLLFSSVSVTADLEASKRTTTRKICTGPEAEMAWIELAKLVYFHSLRALSLSKRSRTEKTAEIEDDGTGFQPRDLRRVVQAGLTRFPNCSVLQSLFFWTEAKQRLHGRVRIWVHEQVTRDHGTRRKDGGGPLASKAPMWIFGLFYELWHQEPYNPHMVRSLLESALESSKQSSSSSSPDLWLVYIELEMRESARQRESASKAVALSSKHKGKEKDKDKNKGKRSSRADFGVESSTRVKQLLMRALNDCPWCKDLYMLAFEPRMRDLFSIEELDQLYQTMLEKEIRIRHDIPERELQAGHPSREDVDMKEDSSDEMSIA